MNEMISIIIPAYNEENYLPRTVEHLERAKRYLQERNNFSLETIVVDNTSTDRTAEFAKSLGSIVVREKIHNIAAVRNTGARASNGEILVFLDADTIVPQNFLWHITRAMVNPTCVGGAVDTLYQPANLFARFYLNLWRLIGLLAGMAQGATQFCRRDVYQKLGGYDETFFMGEDVDFYRRLKSFAKQTRQHVCYIRDIRVIPSCRRFNQWPLWRTLVQTNPFFILFFQRSRTTWSGWYLNAPR